MEDTLIRKAAEQGDAKAQNSMGWMYETGKGVPQDDAKAMKWYRKAAEQGNADAQANLGWMYQNGKGVPQDDAEAVKWYRKAAEQGNADAQLNLGDMCRDGKGVPQDDAVALKWYRKAAEQGYAMAQCNMGWMYNNGKGTPQDDAEAVRWFRKAAEQGDATAQRNLGWMFRNGIGVTQNDAEAVRWFRKAAVQGDANAQSILDEIEEKEMKTDTLHTREWFLEELKKDIDDAFPIRSKDEKRSIKTFCFTNPKAPIITVSRNEEFIDRDVPVYFVSALKKADILIADSAFRAEFDKLTGGLAPMSHIIKGSRTGSFFFIPFLYHMFPSAKAFHQAMESYLSQHERELGLCWVVENLHVSISHLGVSYEPKDCQKSLTM